jgi:hypothetical protein
VASVPFFSDGKTGVFLSLLGSLASKVDVLLQSGVRASSFPSQNAMFFSHLDLKSRFRCGVERAIFFCVGKTASFCFDFIGLGGQNVHFR